MKISKIVSIIKDLGVDVEGVEDALKDKLKDGLNDFGKTLLYKTKEKIKEGVEGFKDSEYEDTTVKLLNKAINIPIVSEDVEAKYIKRAIRLGVDNGKPYALKGIDYAFDKAEEKLDETIDDFLKKD